MKAAKPRIGFIGLGIMGRHMARHLLEAGYPLTVHDIHPEAMEPLAVCGAAPASSCSEVTRRSEVVISMVTDSAAVEEVALGQNGIIGGADDGRFSIYMRHRASGTAVRIAAGMREER